MGQEYNIIRNVEHTGVEREIGLEEFFEQIPNRVENIEDLYPQVEYPYVEQLERESRKLAEQHKIYEEREAKERSPQCERIDLTRQEQHEREREERELPVQKQEDVICLKRRNTRISFRNWTKLCCLPKKKLKRK